MIISKNSEPDDGGFLDRVREKISDGVDAIRDWWDENGVFVKCVAKGAAKSIGQYALEHAPEMIDSAMSAAYQSLENDSGDSDRRKSNSEEDGNGNNTPSSDDSTTSVNVRDEAPMNPSSSDDNDSLSPSTLDMMKKESFMKEAGYSTHLPAEERQSILTDLLKDHSRQEIEDRLNLNMNLKKNSRKNYDDALAAWQQDLDFLQDDEPDD